MLRSGILGFSFAMALTVSQSQSFSSVLDVLISAMLATAVGKSEVSCLSNEYPQIPHMVGQASWVFVLVQLFSQLGMVCAACRVGHGVGCCMSVLSFISYPLYPHLQVFSIGSLIAHISCSYVSSSELGGRFSLVKSRTLGDELGDRRVWRYVVVCLRLPYTVLRSRVRAHRASFVR